MDTGHQRLETGFLFPAENDTKPVGHDQRGNDKHLHYNQA